MTAPREQPGLIVRSTEPLNAETSLELLARQEVTATDLFFVRNHGAVPCVDDAAYRLRVGGLVATALTLSLDDLRTLAETAAVPATLACAGNRRAELDAFRTIAHELPWDAGAVGHAVWRGVRLRDVLAAAGVTRRARHVAFAGLDEAEVDGARVAFGASIPLEKALEADVLLAWEMNGEPLRPEHGFPLRLVVRGYIGARSVKWLATVTVQDRPSSNYFQAHGYRLFAADASGDSREGASLELGEFSLTSAVCRLSETASGSVVLEGTHSRAERARLSGWRSRSTAERRGSSPLSPGKAHRDAGGCGAWSSTAPATATSSSAPGTRLRTRSPKTSRRSGTRAAT